MRSAGRGTGGLRKHRAGAHGAARRAWVRTVEVTIDDMGGGTRGSFQVAGNTGRYSRAASRLDLFDELLAFDKGGAEFTVRGPDFPEPVTARCGFRQTTSTISIVTFTPKKFSYDWIASPTAKSKAWILDGGLLCHEPEGL